MAGEEIDSVFGASWGLSKLAAAGLGNIVADVVGVGCADRIEVCLWCDALRCAHVWCAGLGAADKVDCAAQAVQGTAGVVFSAGCGCCHVHVMIGCAMPSAQHRGWGGRCLACRLVGSWGWRRCCGSMGESF